MRIVGTFICALLLCANLAAEPGKELYQQRCASCHGVDGAGSAAVAAPNISGLNADYLTRQLENYRAGLRGYHPSDIAGITMKTIALGLNDKQLQVVSEYVAAMPRMEIYQSKEFAGFRARGLFSGCGSCHGVAGEGYPSLGAPRISEQYDWYLKAQLQAFRNGWRGTHPDDERGQQMRVMADAIASQEDLDMLVQYITGLGVQP